MLVVYGVSAWVGNTVTLQSSDHDDEDGVTGQEAECSAPGRRKCGGSRCSRRLEGERVLKSLGVADCFGPCN